jgi:hypothetical protein
VGESVSASVNGCCEGESCVLKVVELLRCVEKDVLKKKEDWWNSD